jgi:transposase-like protein
MKTKDNSPKTLQEAILYFSDADHCLQYMVAKRWPNGKVVCPTCGRADVSFLANQRKWQCKSKHDHRQFSVKVGTIFEDSPLGLEKWLPAVWMLTNCKNGVSSYELHRALGVTQKTAWFMLHRIRLTMQDEGAELIGGGGTPVEMDETFIGGKVKNMHQNRKPKPLAKRTERLSGIIGKTIVVGMLERDGRVRAEVVESRTQSVLHALVNKHIAPGLTLMTDEHGGYKGTDFEHEVINHANEYVNGLIHTNGIENFWSLLKRGLNGTYVSVEPFHLFRYIDEQAFRYNNRKTEKHNLNDFDRFDKVASQVVGKRLTYAEVTGKVGAAEAF